MQCIFRLITVASRRHRSLNGGAAGRRGVPHRNCNAKRARLCVCVWGSVRRRTLNAAGALQNSVSVHGDDEDAQVAARRAIDRNQNGPSSAAQSGSVAQPSRAAQMANAFFAGMLSASCAGLRRGGGLAGWWAAVLSAYHGIKTNSFEINAEICFH